MASFLGAIDLVTQNQVTIVTRVGINPSDRLLGDILPGETLVKVNNVTTDTRSIAYSSDSVSLAINTIRNTSITDNYGGDKKFDILPNYPTAFNPQPPSIGYASFNKNVALNFGSLTFTVTNFSSQLFDTPGTTTWTVPAGVTSISVAAVGGGGGGAQNTSGGSGGSGGLLNYVNSVAVTPGDVYTVIVGSGGATGSGYGQNGYDTYMMPPTGNTPVVFANGGIGGDAILWTNPSVSIFVYDYYGTNLIDTQSAYDLQSRVITYSVSSGTLPTGAYLNTYTGQLYWTRQNITAVTEYSSVTLSAAVSGQTITKSYTITVSNAIPLIIDYMIVGGGGAGGIGYNGGGSGGGGGGGITTASSVSIIAGTTFTISIGAGGASTGLNGTTSSIAATSIGFLTIAGSGGGGGYGFLSAAGGGQDGTSGGGGSAGASTSGGGGNPIQSGSTSPGPWGCAGGSGITAGSAYWSGGGGGGWARVGYSGSAGSGGAGGIGSSSTCIFIISSANANTLGFGQYVGAVSGAYVAGGGGGGVSATGSPAAGIGGSGGGANAGANGLANTGGGGGGSTTPSFAAGTGGSGVVLIRTTSTYRWATLTGTVSTSTLSNSNYYKFTGAGTITF